MTTDEGSVFFYWGQIAVLRFSLLKFRFRLSRYILAWSSAHLYCTATTLCCLSKVGCVVDSVWCNVSVFIFAAIDIPRPTPRRGSSSSISGVQAGWAAPASTGQHGDNIEIWCAHCQVSRRRTTTCLHLYIIYIIYITYFVKLKVYLWQPMVGRLI